MSRLSEHPVKDSPYRKFICGDECPVCGGIGTQADVTW